MRETDAHSRMNGWTRRGIGMQVESDLAVITIATWFILATTENAAIKLCILL